MKRNVIYILSLLFLVNFCSSSPAAHDSIATGEWKYKLAVNGVSVGTAVISNKIKDGNYVSSSEYSMKLADLDTTTKDVVTETMDFKPVRLESSTKIRNNGKDYGTDIVTVFNGRNVELTYGTAGKKVNYTIGRDFIIDGGYFTNQLIKSKFKEGIEIVNYVYNPSVELETPIKAVTKVAGREKITINGTEKNLIHIVQSIENIKDNIDIYADPNGIMQRGIIHMLNLKIELEILQ
jgi:hypothetical protein